MSDKQQIVDAIVRIAKQLRRAPSQSEFIARSGISEYRSSQVFPRWSDAVKAAGLQPYSQNIWIDDSELLKDWGKHVRRNGGRLPRRVYQRDGEYTHPTFVRRFGSWSLVPRAFLKFAEGKREWADVAALLAGKRKEAPAPSEKRRSSTPPNRSAHPALKDRSTYGNPMRFRGLLHEPVNEQGVIVLFAMLAEELGYRIETIHNEFPDCQAMRRIGSGRWQRVSIEFEFESRSYRDHGHPLGGCDVIVCWRDNWADCPQHIEVLELSKQIKKSETEGARISVR